MKTYRLIIFGLFVYIVSSCSDDFLDRPPLDQIGTESYWNTKDDLENYIKQFYATLPAHASWGSAIGYEITNSDNLIEVTPNAVMDGQRGGANGRWTNDWSNIRGVNIFFDNYSKCQDDFDLYKQFLGEAHFFRAWFYYELVKKYGDVPWVNTQLFPNSTEELNSAKDPRTVVVDSILADLVKAKEYLSYKADVGNLRLNKETALAFSTRVALYEGSWQKYHSGTPFGTPGADPNKYFAACVSSAQELFDTKYSHGLHSDYYEMFGEDDMSENKEIFLYRAYNLTDGIGNDMQYATTAHPSELGVTWSMVSSYLDKNGDPFDYLTASMSHKGNAFLSQLGDKVDPRFLATVWTPGAIISTRSQRKFDKPQIDGVSFELNTTGFQLKKGSNPDSPAAGQDGGGKSETGYIYFRYGEVLLNYAEAWYEMNGDVAYDVLNQIRSRAGMPDFKVIAQASDPNLLNYGYPISDALYEIRRERRIELAFEGLRADDYKRWAAHALFKDRRPKGYPFDQEEFPDYHPPLDEEGRIDYFQSIMPLGYQFRPDQDYLSPIPKEELTLNPNLTQNPGW